MLQRTGSLSALPAQRNLPERINELINRVLECTLNCEMGTSCGGATVIGRWVTNNSLRIVPLEHPCQT